MRRSDKEVFDKIPFLHFRAADAFTASVLLPVSVKGQPLDVSLVADDNNDVFLRNEVFQVEIADSAYNFGAPFVAKAVFDFYDVVFDDVQHQLVL